MAIKKIWDDDVNYKSEMDKAYREGRFKDAADYEVKRNAKIDYLNETGTNTYGAEKSNDYKGWLNPTDYTTKGQYQMATKAPTWEVEETLNNRYNKALGTKGMEQFLNDGVMQEMIDYIAQNKGGYNDILHSRPTHESKNDAKIDEMYDKIMNREAFSYNAESDPLYQQYAEMYRREGDRAMRNTLAEVAMGAGGMNSYAITAAQQANDYYNQKLADKIPELYQLAYSMYLDEGNRMRDDLGLLIDMENNDYNRYLNDLGQWNNDLNFAYGRERDEYLKGIDERDWNYQLERDAITDALAEKSNAQNWVEFLLSRNVTPSQQDLDAAGLTPEQYEQWKNWYYNQNFTTGGSGGGRSGGSSKSGSKNLIDKKVEGGDDNFSLSNMAKSIGGVLGSLATGVKNLVGSSSDDYTMTNTHDDNSNWIVVSGIGRVSYEELYNMVNNGTVKEYVDEENKTITYRKA